jgi:hypothetical protein
MNWIIIGLLWGALGWMIVVGRPSTVNLTLTRMIAGDYTGTAIIVGILCLLFWPFSDHIAHLGHCYVMNDLKKRLEMMLGKPLASIQKADKKDTN